MKDSLHGSKKNCENSLTYLQNLLVGDSFTVDAFDDDDGQTLQNS